jgi:hypothetical protein
LRNILEDFDDLESVTIAIDAVGEGSGLADRLQHRYPDVCRFKAGSAAAQADEFRDKWAEALADFGNFLGDSGSFNDRRLREELLVAARTITFEERFLSSRGRNGSTVLQASKKSAVKANLGRSPDFLDASIMAIWASMNHQNSARKEVHRGTPESLRSERSTAADRGESSSRVRRRSDSASVRRRRRGRRAKTRDLEEKKRRWWSRWLASRWLPPARPAALKSALEIFWA